MMADIPTKISQNKIIFLTAVFLLILLVFSAAFMLLEGKTFIDSIYWAVVTLATVGYGDITPHTDVGKIFTMILIVLGITMYGLIIQAAGASIVERVYKEVMGMKECDYTGHVIIAGWDSPAEELLLELKANDIEVAVITGNPDTVQSIRNMGAFVISGDHTKDLTLLSAGIKNAKVVAILTESDLDVLVTTLRCKALNKEITVVAKVSNADIIEVVKEAGVSTVINPDTINSRLLASAAFEPHIVDFIEDVTTARYGNDLREYTVKEKSALAGKTVGEALADFRKETGLLLLAVIRDGKTITNPPNDVVINPGDGVILLGNHEQFEKAKQLLWH